MLFALAPLLAGASVLFFILYHLLQPTVLPNPGLAAYTAPVSTRTIALPTSGKELIYQPPMPSPSTAFAQASGTPSEPAAPASVRKQPRSRRAASHEHEDRQPSFSQQAIFGYRGGPRFSF